MSSLKILFIGDICGSLGRKTATALVPGLRKEFSVDLVIANGENAAHGKGLTAKTADELFAAGIDWLTSGDHCFDQASGIEDCFGGNRNIIRPANYAADAPGNGYAIISTDKGDVLLMNLIGRVFMSRQYDDPFRKAEEILNNCTDKRFSAILADIHAEATSEKIALRHFLDGRIGALIGTHTHVQTADKQITAKGTGYMSDVGMTGLADGVIGIAAAPIVAAFLSQTKQKHELPDTGSAMLNGVVLSFDPVNGHCLDMNPIQRFITIS